MDFILEKIKPIFNISDTKLTKKQISILRYITENMDDATYMTLRQMCANIGCSQVTMMRLCRELGYESFVDFRSALRDLKSGRLTDMKNMENTTDAELLDRVMFNEKALMSSFFDSVNKESFAACAAKIVDADFVLILGSGISGIIGQSLAFRLTQCSIENIAADPKKEPDRVRQLSRILTGKSVVIGLSFPTYNPDQAQIIRNANMNGAFTVAITDNDSSPVAQTASVSLISPISGDNVYNSFVTALETVNLLIHSITIKMGLTYNKLRQ